MLQEDMWATCGHNNHAKIEIIEESGVENKVTVH
jgi:hypothetical protein